MDIAFDYQVTQPGVILDVGSYNGEFIDFVRPKYQCGVHAFEPSKEKFVELLKKYAYDPMIWPYNVALEDENCEKALFGTNNSKTLYGNAQNIQEAELVQVRDIWGFIQSFKLPKIDILKLNCEGSEYKILMRLHENGFLSQVSNIVVQWHAVEVTHHGVVDDCVRLRESVKLQLEGNHELKFNCPNSNWQWWVKK